MFVEHMDARVQLDGTHMDARVQLDVLGVFECFLNVGVHLEHP